MSIIRRCRECGEDISDKGPRAEFCCSAHRMDWNNRRGSRGSELYDLFMAYRYNRGVAKELGIFAAMCTLASRWRKEDNGRISYTDPHVALARLDLMPQAESEEASEA